MKYQIYLFGGLYDETTNKQDAVDTVAFLEDEHGPEAAYMEKSEYPLRPEAPFWGDDVVW
jgi:hypothetical protein